MKTLVIGSSGFLGRAVVPHLTGDPVAVTHCRQPRLPDSIAFDLLRDDPARLLLQVRPDQVLVTAKLFDAGASEASLQEHRGAVERFAQAARDLHLVFLSTDAVFEGTRGRYREEEERRPTTPYGRQLKAFEDIVLSRGSRVCVIRPSYLYGCSGGALDSRLERTRVELQAGRAMRCFTDMYKSPMEVGRAAAAIVQLARLSVTGPVHIGGPRTSVFEFQTDAMQALGIEHEKLEPETMPADFAFPRDTSLDTSRMTDLTGLKPVTVSDSLSGARVP